VGQNREDNQTNRNAMISDTYTFSHDDQQFAGGTDAAVVYLAGDQMRGRSWRSILSLAGELSERAVGCRWISDLGRIGGGAVGNRGSLNWDIQNMLTKVAGNHTVKIRRNSRPTAAGFEPGRAGRWRGTSVLAV
jgi:hypothetical protein